MQHDQQRSLINHEIIFLNATELSTLMHVLGTDKLNNRSHLNIVKLIKQIFLCKEKNYK